MSGLFDYERHASQELPSELRERLTPFLAAAIHLYERAGFRISTEAPHDLFGTRLITMTKPIDDVVRGGTRHAGAAGEPN